MPQQNIVACGDLSTFAFRIRNLPSGSTINLILPNGSIFDSMISANAIGASTANGANITLTTAAPDTGILVEYNVQTLCSPTIDPSSNAQITYSVGSITESVDFPDVDYPIVEISNIQTIGNSTVSNGQFVEYDVTLTQGRAYNNSVSLYIRHNPDYPISLSVANSGVLTPGSVVNGWQTDVLQLSSSQFQTIGNNN